MCSKIEPHQFEKRTGSFALSRLSARSGTAVGGCSRSLPGQSFIAIHVRPYSAQRPPGRMNRPVRVQVIKFLCCSSTIAATKVDDERTPQARTSVRVADRSPLFLPLNCDARCSSTLSAEPLRLVKSLHFNRVWGSRRKLPPSRRPLDLMRVLAMAKPRARLFSISCKGSATAHAAKAALVPIL